MQCLHVVIQLLLLSQFHVLERQSVKLTRWTSVSVLRIGMILG